MGKNINSVNNDSSNKAGKADENKFELNDTVLSKEILCKSRVIDLNGTSFKITDGDKVNLYRCALADFKKINSGKFLDGKAYVKDIMHFKSKALAYPRAWPIPVSAKKIRITSKFGAKRSQGGNRFWHTGIDFGALRKTPISATGNAVVKYAGWRGHYGRIVILEHKNGFETRYAHCGKIFVKKGQVVSVGDIIAEVGNSGRSTGPHLHYEIRLNGKPLNPARFIKGINEGRRQIDGRILKIRVRKKRK